MKQPTHRGKIQFESAYDKNNPIKSKINQDYITQSLNMFRQQNIDRYGSSKVPTPSVKDVYKQCAARNSTMQESTDKVEASVDAG